MLRLRVDCPDIRLDRFLARALGVSRQKVLLLLSSQLVRLNGQDIGLKAKGWKLAVGDQIEIRDYAALEHVVPQKTLPLDILHEEPGMLFVNKPAGQPVMPQQPYEQGTLLNAVVGRYPELQGLGEGGLKSAVVHRLDNDTSGAMVFAKNQHSWQRLRKAFQEHQSVKVYQALVVGELQGEGEVVKALEIYQHRPARVRVSTTLDKKSRCCRMQWQVKQQWAGFSLVDVVLETGFLHQIRVMMAHMGYPVVADRVYGTAQPGVKRQLLHASYLQVLGVDVFCPLAADFQAFLHGLER